MKHLLIYSCCLVLCLNVKGQSLPYNPIFDDTKVSSVFIIMDADSLNDMYENYSNGHEYLCTFIFNDGITSDTVPQTAIRFRGNTSLGAAKKSFKISFNTYLEGREYSGVKKLNLNGSHNDPSMVREKLYFDVYNAFGLPVRRSSFVRVYINGDYFGLYTNIEEMDEIFLRDRYGESSGNLYKCTWPSDLTWHGNDQSYYENGPYDLQTNEQQNNYDDLIHFIDVLNNTSDPNFQCEIEQVFDVERFLKIYALDISAGHWDNYGANNNNFYLYHNQFTGKFEFLSYDCDNTFGVDWFGIDWGTRNIYEWQFDNRPLVDRLLDVPEYRDKFSYYINELGTTILSEDSIFPKIDAYRDLIDEAAFEDVYRTYDYGYTYEDFLNSFDTDDIDSHTPYGIKNFITARTENTSAQVELNDIFPVAVSNLVDPPMPDPADEINFRLQTLDDGSITNVTLWLMLEFLYNPFTMYDDGLHNDSLSNDGIFGIELSPLPAGEYIYYFEITDNTANVRRYPFCSDSFLLRVGYTAPGLVINEFMARNQSTITDDAGDYEDYIEVYNKSAIAIYLGDKFLSDELDNPFKWRMPDVVLPSDGYLLVWADDEWEESIYHSTFKLDGDKDEIFIFDHAQTYFALIDSISFTDQLVDTSVGRLPNGTGAFTYLPQPSPGYNNEGTINPGDSLTNNQLVIFANPSYEQLIFNAEIATATSQTSIGLFDINGRMLNEIENNMLDQGIYTYSVNTTAYSNGVYFLRAIFDDTMITYRIVIL